MPVEKEKPWHGLALECPVVLDATSPLYAMRCFSYKLRAHKPLFRGLSVATRGELSNAFRLSQAYAYILPHFSAQKLAKFQNKKAGAIAPACVGSEEFVFSARCSIEFDGRLAAAHASIVFDDAEVIAEGTLHFLIV